MTPEQKTWLKLFGAIVETCHREGKITRREMKETIDEYFIKVQYESERIGAGSIPKEASPDPKE